MLNVSLIRSVLLAAIARSDGFPCGWFSEGVTLDHWRLAQGKPNVFLWLASTGTNQRPVKPFALIELRGQQANNFLSSKIPYQDEIAILSLSYWIVGGPNLEVCLVDSLDKKFNCTAMRVHNLCRKKFCFHCRKFRNHFDGCTRLVKSCTKLANVSATHSEINVSGAYLAVFFSRKTVTKNKYQLCAVTALEEKIRLACSWRKLYIDLIAIQLKIHEITVEGITSSAENSGVITTSLMKPMCVTFVNRPDGYPAPSYPVATALQGRGMLTSDPLKCQNCVGKFVFLLNSFLGDTDLFEM
ncbi:hypothetical protein LOAG_08388 [Loa loa]|uniref:Secreted protein n=1 Tax=Loa loa TaxID=7209 RepID=A0A1S0TTP6_LOALO|nr:hypothetical protein LOAG_08388 [Loa loa]EFO20102.2 hypothetical protein LOAG_08388 [Loa loa]